MLLRQFQAGFASAVIAITAVAGQVYGQMAGQGMPQNSTNMAPMVDSANTEALLQNLRKLTDDPVSAIGSPASISGCGSGNCGSAMTWDQMGSNSGGYCGTNCTSSSLFSAESCGSSCGGCCDSGCCDSGCGDSSCCGGRYAGIEVFGEYLYLRPRDAEVAYAVPVDGPVAPVLDNGIQVGRTAVVDIGQQAAFRVGIGTVNTACGRVIGAWTHFDSSESDSINTTTPNLIRSLVTHPLGNNVAVDGLSANAQYDIDFDLVDLAAQTPILRAPCWALDALWGVRYGQLDQTFSSTLQFNGNTNVSTAINFNGVGPRVGLLGQRTIGRRGMYLLGRGEASFLVGTFDAAYQQRSDFAGVLVDTSWEAGRIMPQLEMELGFGFGSRTGRFQLRAGYLVSAWYNAVTTDEYIHSVQINDPRDLGNGLTFDGLVVRSELRF